jgi:carbon storage regulator
VIGRAPVLPLLYELIGAYSQGGLTMLVLSRKSGEGIVIGDGVVVTVVAVGGDRVRLGICAPPATSIHREEVWKRIERIYARPRESPSSDAP